MEGIVRALCVPLLAALAVILYAAPAQAADRAQVRLVHAVPGAGSAELGLSGGTRSASVAFGEAGDFRSVPAGPARLELYPRGEEKVLTASSDDLEPGRRYTVVALAGGSGAELRVLADGEAVPGKARLRMVHAAPELGEPDVSLDGRTISSRTPYTTVTSYLTLEPGSYDLSADRPSGDGDPLLSMRDVPLAAGSASTAVVVGSRGEPTRAVLVADDTVGPDRPPDTGLGGLARQERRGLVAIMLATLLGGALGGGGYLLATRPAGRRS